MKTSINIGSSLKELEQQKGIKILYACETGSRAWGFPSPDSDYDIRFLYKHDRNWYLKLGIQKDSIEQMTGEEDISGWDLRKSLRLLKRSNAPLIERFQSPVVYMEAEGFRDNFKKLIHHYYSPKAVFFHHYSLAQKFWKEMEGKKQVKLKSFFYLTRSLLSCRWITRDDSVLPMHLEGLLAYADTHDRERLRELVILKSTVDESYLHNLEQNVSDRINSMFNELRNAGNSLSVNNSDYRLLDEFLLNELK